MTFDFYAADGITTSLERAFECIEAEKHLGREYLDDEITYEEYCFRESLLNSYYGKND